MHYTKLLISSLYRCIETELRKGQCDVMEVLWYFNNKILGMDTMTLEEALPLATGNDLKFIANSQLPIYSGKWNTVKSC